MYRATTNLRDILSGPELVVSGFAVNLLKHDWSLQIFNMKHGVASSKLKVSVNEPLKNVWKIPKTLFSDKTKDNAVYYVSFCQKRTDRFTIWKCGNVS